MYKDVPLELQQTTTTKTPKNIILISFFSPGFIVLTDNIQPKRHRHFRLRVHLTLVDARITRLWKPYLQRPVIRILRPDHLYKNETTQGNEFKLQCFTLANGPILNHLAISLNDYFIDERHTQSIPCNVPKCPSHHLFRVLPMR